MHGVQVVDTEIDVAFERGSLPLLELATADLEVRTVGGALHDRVDAVGLGGRWLAHAVHRIEAAADPRDAIAAASARAVRRSVSCSVNFLRLRWDS